ncbi:MAG: glyoxalase [Actinomycetota bacterium]
MSDQPSSPQLRRLHLRDRPDGWAAAGFAVDDGRTRIGSIELRFGNDTGDGADAGVIGWELAGAGGPTDLDGLTTTWVDEPPGEPVVHPNGVSRLDHVVIATPHLARTIDALEGAGFEARRTRDVPGTEPLRQQVFLWAGETILEVVGPAAAPGAGDGDRPASVWGLALTTTDLDGAVELLGDHLSAPKDAVQRGRRIATIDTRSLGIGTALAVMTPHVDPDGA